MLTFSSTSLSRVIIFLANLYESVAVHSSLFPSIFMLFSKKSVAFLFYMYYNISTLRNAEGRERGTI